MGDFSGNFWGRPVHDAYVQTMSEIGMVGGFVFIGMFLVILTQLLLAGVKATKDGEGRLRPCLIAVLALMALMISEPDMDNSNTWLILGLTETAILVGQGRRGFRVNMLGAMSAIEGLPPRPSEAETPRSARAE
jgi:O-antigen ligase